jgi:hypothetical protein
MGQKKDYSQLHHHFHYAPPFLTSVAFLAILLAASTSTMQFNSELALETGESKTLAMSSLHFVFLGAKSFSESLTLDGKVGGSGSSAGE